jgi:hypothetical protein
VAHLAGWLAVALAIAFLCRRKPMLGTSIALAIWVLIPSVAAYHVVGAVSGPLAAHPATWLLLVQVGIGLLFDPQPLGRAFNRHLPIFVIGGFFIVGAFVTSLLTGSSSLRLLLDEIVGPLMVFWLISAYAFGDRREMHLVRNTIIVLAVGESFLALTQSWQHRMLFYESDYLTLYWFDPERFDRWMGTTDSPLVIALLVCVAAPLAVGLQNTPIRLAAMISMLIGALTSQSRFGVAVMCGLFIYMLVRGRMSFFTRLLVAVLLMIAGRAILASDLVTGISSRLSNDTGSSEARAYALNTFFGMFHDILLTGNGLTSNFRLASEAGLQTSLESSFLMYAVDVGLPLTLLYFGSQAFLVLLHGPGNRMQGAFIAAGMGVIMQHTFSGVAVSNMSAAVIWAAVGLVAAGSRRFDGRQDVGPKPRVEAARAPLASAP